MMRFIKAHHIWATPGIVEARGQHGQTLVGHQHDSGGALFKEEVTNLVFICGAVHVIEYLRGYIEASMMCPRNQVVG